MMLYVMKIFVTLVDLQCVAVNKTLINAFIQSGNEIPNECI